MGQFTKEGLDWSQPLQPLLLWCIICQPSFHQRPSMHWNWNISALLTLWTTHFSTLLGLEYSSTPFEHDLTGSAPLDHLIGLDLHLYVAGWLDMGTWRRFFVYISATCGRIHYFVTYFLYLGDETEHCLFGWASSKKVTWWITRNCYFLLKNPWGTRPLL